MIRRRGSAAPALYLLGLCLLSSTVLGASAPALADPRPDSAPVAVPMPVTAPESAAGAASAADSLAVEVWTFGPGDHPFTKFGHNAIRILDRSAGVDVAYNFGTFAFGSTSLIGEFLQGRLRYWLSFARTAATARAYHRENRSIEIQRLALTSAQKRELARRLEVNALPANRDYRYDYFTDNCSTRVRDAIDGVLGGQLHALARRPGAETLRANALRMTADTPWLYVALLIVLGPSTDRPLDEWGEDFLPEKLQQTMRDLRVDDGGGHVVPLVAAERIAFAAARPPVRRIAPRWLGWFLAFGGSAGTALWALGRRAARAAPAPARGRWARVLFGVMAAGWGLTVGAIGCFLLGSWMFTPHVAVYRNQNLLPMAPFVIVLAAFGAGVASGRPGSARWVFVVAAAATVLSALAGLVKLFPAAVMARQDNLAVIAACLPTWLGLTLGARALRGAVRGRAGSST
jgi:hypothetical protein